MRLNGVATIEHSASGGGYGGVTVPSVTATEADNDNRCGRGEGGARGDLRCDRRR